MPDAPPHPVTPDGRYFVVRGRLWRLSDPQLTDEVRAKLTSDLMRARSAMRKRDLTPEARRRLRAAVDRAKRALGERGPVWWTDGAPDDNRRMARNTVYAEWFAGLSAL